MILYIMERLNGSYFISFSIIFTVNFISQSEDQRLTLRIFLMEVHFHYLCVQQL